MDQAKGVLDGPRQQYTIGANDQLLTSAQYQPIVVAYKNGAPVRLSDVANIIDGAENVQQAAWMNQRPAVIVNIQRQPGANVISVADRVKTLLPVIEGALPPGVQVHILIDLTQTIRASVKDVQFELMLTVCLVVMVIFLFLRNLRATVIPSIAVPLSIVGTFAVMYLLGYSLNNLTLMALTISTGFVVDDAIVMIENIDRFLEEGDSPLQAALKGAGQIGFTIVSLTVSLIAVLIPLLFMGDIVGRLFREFAVTLAVTILVSAVVSLTLTPMMCAKLLRPKGSQQSRFYVASEGFYNRRDRLLRPHPEVRLALSANHLAHHRRDFGVDAVPLCSRTEGILSGAGYGRDSRHFRSAGEYFVCCHGGAAAGPGARHSAGSGCRQPLVVHRRGRNQYHAQRAAASRSISSRATSVSRRLRT